MSTAVATATATWYAVSGGNDCYWRAEAPAKAVGGKACLIAEDTGGTAVTQPNDHTDFRWFIRVLLESGEQREFRTTDSWHEFTFDRPRIHNYEIVYPDHEGAAIWVRPDHVRERHSSFMRGQGFRQIAEVDDNYIGDPKLNLFMRSNKWDEKAVTEHLTSLARHDAIVFSTNYLRDLYFKTMKKRWGKAALPEFHVCGNHVDLEDWPERVEREDKLRVGWMGSPSHIWDVDLAWPALLMASRMGCETWMIGFNPALPETQVQPGDLHPRWKTKIREWEKVGFKHVPWRKPEQYERLGLPLDIGLCPLLTNEFTLGKSDVKAVEYTIAGAAVVAWNNSVYNKTWKHGETALLVGSPSEMIDAVTRLAQDDRLRERLVENAQEYVREERGLKQLRAEWLAAING